MSARFLIGDRRQFGNTLLLWVGSRMNSNTEKWDPSLQEQRRGELCRETLFSLRGDTIMSRRLSASGLSLENTQKRPAQKPPILSDHFANFLLPMHNLSRTKNERQFLIRFGEIARTLCPEKGFKSGLERVG